MTYDFIPVMEPAPLKSWHFQVVICPLVCVCAIVKGDGVWWSERHIYSSLRVGYLIYVLPLWYDSAYGIYPDNEINDPGDRRWDKPTYKIKEKEEKLSSVLSLYLVGGPDPYQEHDG